jgi:hypothetical protein
MFGAANKVVPMPNPTYFIHECPICGRQLQVRVEYLGARVACPHCRGDFNLATHRERKMTAAPAISLLERAEHLLASVDDRRLRLG